MSEIHDIGIIIRVLEEKDYKIWEEFIAQFEEVNFFHSPWITSIFQPSSGCEVYPIAAFIGRNIVALASAVLIPVRLPVPKKYRCRFILYASPLFIKSEEGYKGIQCILSYLSEIGKKKSLFLEIRNTHNFPTDNLLDLTKQWLYLPYQNYLIDLSQGPERLWQTFSSYVRNHVNKSLKNGVNVRSAEGDEAMQSFNLIYNLYKGKKIPMLSRDIFDAAVKNLIHKNMLKVLIAEYANKMIATRWSLAYGGTLYDWYAGTDYEYGKLYPNELLTWKMMEWGAVSGYKIFDFGGAGIKGENYGPAKFKEKFHGTLIEYGRWRLPSNPIIYTISKYLYEIVKI